MADYHRPYHRDLRPPPSSVPDPTVFHGNGYFSSVSPQANGYFSSAPKDGAFPGARDRRIEIYAMAPPPLAPPPCLRKTASSGLRPPPRPPSASTVPSPRRASHKGVSPPSSPPSCSPPRRTHSTPPSSPSPLAPNALLPGEPTQPHRPLPHH
ncbi:hypothetical protein ZWY2020_010919 [Hordeum vulgare]|nr:hypothetical protein ZWY2020_010919 [Hordeum vulgare]